MSRYLQRVVNRGTTLLAISYRIKNNHYTSSLRAYARGGGVAIVPLRGIVKMAARVVEKLVVLASLAEVGYALNVVPLTHDVIDLSVLILQYLAYDGKDCISLLIYAQRGVGIDTARYDFRAVD